MNFSAEELAEGILSGNKRLLAKAITLVESRIPEHRETADEVLARLMPYTGKSVRVGITGVPGAGKSTFIENFGLLAVSKGKKVAVLAIDPSSSVNKGSILGDKTRMEELARSEAAFIRPSPSSGFLGGVANATFETMLLCEAAGYDYILIETVGVGQSETLVADIADVFLFIKIIGGGDSLQGIKRGIMELADIIFINKVTETNLPAAKNTKLELKRALHFLQPKETGWQVPVLLGSALENSGLTEVYDEVDRFINLKKTNNTLLSSREDKAAKRFDFWVQHYILAKIGEAGSAGDAYESGKKKASSLEASPAAEARAFVEKIFNKE